MLQRACTTVVLQPVPSLQYASQQNVARIEQEAERLSGLGVSLEEELRRLSRLNADDKIEENQLEVDAELSHYQIHQQSSPPHSATAAFNVSENDSTRSPLLQQRQQYPFVPSTAFTTVLPPSLPCNSIDHEKIKVESVTLWPGLQTTAPIAPHFADTSTFLPVNMAVQGREGPLVLSLTNPSDFQPDEIMAGELTPRAGQSPVSTSRLANPGVSYAQDVQYQAYVLPKPDFDNGQYLSPGEQFHGPEQDRPSTAASADTFHQAQTLFQDFDGTHYASSIKPLASEIGSIGPSNRLSSMLRQPPQLNNRVPPPSEGMVFYPAPIPTNLNIPQRLSKALPASIEAKRRTQMLSTITPDARKSAIWLDGKVPNISDAAGTEDPMLFKNRMSMLPPQLRASMFFENPTSIAEVKVRDKSAMATLEDLLDASTSAPVSAFTDHPFAGKSGSDVYKRAPVRKRQSTMPALLPPPKLEKRRSSFLGLRRLSTSTTDLLGVTGNGLKKRGSRAFSMGGGLDDSASGRNSVAMFGRARSEADALSDTEDSKLEDDEEDISTSDEDEDVPLANLGPPTTLLAELQLRKEEQKKRNRTAVTAFPDGMHSTLLEMDAVMQIQKKKRQTGRVTLAWEDPDHVRSTERQKPEDEDVPLGMLYASKDKVQAHLKGRGMGDWDRPLGLIELREREDNEPLSFRRARLKGFDPYAPQEPNPQAMFGAPTIQVDDQHAMDFDDEPEESLADRKKRLNSQKSLEEVLGDENVRVISQAFSADLNLESLDFNGSPRESMKPAEEPPVDEEEETLGQRRARLQKLAQHQSQLSLQAESQSAIPQARPLMNRASTSFADLLHTVPLGAARKLSDRDLVAGLPQDSLLKRSEDIRTARKSAFIQTQNGYTQSTFNQAGGQAFDNRASMAFRGGTMNNGFGGVTLPVNEPHRPLLNVRQSSYSSAAQSHLNLFSANNPMMVSQQNPYMGMNMPGNTMGMVDPMIMNQLQILQGMHMNVSTPNLLGQDFMGMPQQRHPPMGLPQMQMGMGMSMSMQQQQQMAMEAALAEASMDPRAKSRIDAWRESVQMD